MNDASFHLSRRAALWLVVVAVAGWAAFAAGVVLAPQRAWICYLAAYVYTLTLAVGALFLVMIAHTTGARWFIVVRRVAEDVSIAVLLLALLFVPILLVLRRLYPWVPPLDGLTEHVRTVVLRKAAYLNVPFFVGRAVLYLVLWSLLAIALRRWSLAQDEDGRAPTTGHVVAISGAGLMVLGFSFTFAMFDWVMSLAPDWYSTMFGVYLFAGAMIGALGLIAVLARALEVEGTLAGDVAASHYHALGRLMLTFVVFWTYIAYSQGFLIWIADLPHEVGFFTARIVNGWGAVLIVLAIGHFGAPFFLLLSRRLKRNGTALALVGAWLLLMHYVDVFWIVVPALDGATPLHWLDLPALVALLATSALFVAWLASGKAAVPRNDPRLARSLEYQSP